MKFLLKVNTSIYTRVGCHGGHFAVVVTKTLQLVELNLRLEHRRRTVGDVACNGGVLMFIRNFAGVPKIIVGMRSKGFS